jgi:hypothetical protein
MPQVSGRIVVVQEGRFLLEDDDGGHRLFIASHALGLDPENLRVLARSRGHITVRYSEPEHLVAGIAEKIELRDITPNNASQALRRSIADAMRGFLRDWSLPRQLSGQSDRSDAAKSTESSQLAARLVAGDSVGTSICAYCAVGCAQLVYSRDGKVIHVEGDPRSPINEGTLCPATRHSHVGTG